MGSRLHTCSRCLSQLHETQTVCGLARVDPADHQAAQAAFLRLLLCMLYDEFKDVTLSTEAAYGVADLHSPQLSRFR